MVFSNLVADIFVYCYFGKIATYSFSKMADLLYELNWNELPIRHQKYVILMIANMQRPLYYHGFHVITLNLETFTKVMFVLNLIESKRHWRAFSSYSWWIRFILTTWFSKLYPRIETLKPTWTCMDFLESAPVSLT